MTWDPDRYARFREERARPFHDLLARVPEIAVRSAADLGCGTGDLTRRLTERWPGAEVVGVDLSPEMLARARPEPGLRFVEADLRSWEPAGPLDLLISNAALHWVPDHRALLGRLASFLAPAGVLAVQVPRNRREPAYAAISEVASDPRWRDRVPSHTLGSSVESAEFYLAALQDVGLLPDVWETVYHHPMPGPEAILEWLAGTTLRPALTALPPEEGAELLARLRPHLERAYPAGPHGTVFPFRRLFFVARRR